MIIIIMMIIKSLFIFTRTISRKCNDNNDTIKLAVHKKLCRMISSAIIVGVGKVMDSRAWQV